MHDVLDRLFFCVTQSYMTGKRKILETYMASTALSLMQRSVLRGPRDTVSSYHFLGREE